jgi:tetratricopeptide (TPR) repeat protein
LSFNLAFTWQRKLRGVHSWEEIVPLYSQALDDFTSAVANDTETSRQKQYTTLFIPWAKIMLNNAAHLQLADQAIDLGDYLTARRELELVVALFPKDAGVKMNWDPLTEPRPEYSLVYGLTSLALDGPQDFPNPQTETPKVNASYDAIASYELAIAHINDNAIVDPKSRATVYRSAITRLDILMKQGLRSNALVAAKTIRRELAQAAARASDLPLN